MRSAVSLPTPSGVGPGVTSSRGSAPIKAAARLSPGYTYSRVHTGVVPLSNSMGRLAVEDGAKKKKKKKSRLKG